MNNSRNLVMKVVKEPIDPVVPNRPVQKAWPVWCARMRENLQQRKEVLDTREKCLADNTLEATECLKALWDKGLIRGK
jgi:hypothetical protein